MVGLSTLAYITVDPGKEMLFYLLLRYSCVEFKSHMIKMFRFVINGLNDFQHDHSTYHSN